MLQDAKACFSEVVRRATTVGPQHVTVHGRDSVVVLDAAEWRQLTGGAKAGLDLVAALQASPYREVEIEPERWDQPVVLRQVDL